MLKDSKKNVNIMKTEVIPIKIKDQIEFPQLKKNNICYQKIHWMALKTSKPEATTQKLPN